MGRLRDTRLVPISLVGQDTRFSPWLPWFQSRMGNLLFLFSSKSLGEQPSEKNKKNKSNKLESQVSTIGLLACPSGYGVRLEI